ncbi:MAG: DUF2298 domain-containing protein [Anaerolineales bacterium]
MDLTEGRTAREEQPEVPSDAMDSRTFNWRQYVPHILLLIVLGLAAYLRFTGLNWDEGAHLHPDERFLTLVEGAIQPVQSLSEYFNTNTSTLNPNNVGHTFFVYGTLPIFIVRYVAEWLGQTGYGEVFLVGRGLSATFSLITVLLSYLIGRKLYRERVGLLAAAFTAFAVLLIQHAHFFVVDPFANTFIMTGFYLAVLILDRGKLADYLLFGVFLGMAVASKISAAPLAGLAVLAAAVRYLKAEDDEKATSFNQGLLGLGAAAFLSLLVFRFFQPYAFTGPSFFGIRLNPEWVSTMAEVRRQTSGEVDFPPALQWAGRTPVWFSWRNMVLYGMGLPLGLTAWISWAAASVQIFRRKNWSSHVLPVAWVAVFFFWQSSGFTQAMRYQLPVYPILAVLASWGLWRAWDWASSRRFRRSGLVRGGVGVLGIGVLMATMAYAFGFLRVYTQPMTRVEASRWIYHNIPAAANLVVETEEGEQLEPMAVPMDFVLHPGSPESFSFSGNHSGTVEAILTPFVHSLASESQQYQLTLAIYPEKGLEALATANFNGLVAAQGETRLELPLQPSLDLQSGARYRLELHLEGPYPLQLDGEPSLVMNTEGGEQVNDVQLPEEELVLRAAQPQNLTFKGSLSGQAVGVRLANPSALSDFPIEINVTLRDPAADQELAEGQLVLRSPAEMDEVLTVEFREPAPISEMNYLLTIELLDSGAIALRPATLINETSWDDALPVRMDGYDPGGRYLSVNQQLYWPDDEDKNRDGVSDKLERIVDSLAAGDYLVISSNRQYGTIGRVPSRYPLSSAYYRALFNCPPPTSVSACAARAQPGEVNSELGFRLAKVFETNPGVLGLEINDQLAEESFTVYDHPKVLIFEKTGDFDRETALDLLGGVDLSNVQNLGAGELGAATAAPTLKLPLDRWRHIQQSGTWREIFPPGNPLNQIQPLAVVVWWLVIGLIGWIVFPLVSAAFPGLRDGGYTIARAGGLLLFAWIGWLLGSMGLPLTRGTLWLILLGLAMVAATYFYFNRSSILGKVRRARREILFIEILALAFFLLDLAIRFGNPDLWHPSKGGEKPMDLSYLTAVIKSPTFPPYDPWFAGGYINYYYFGFVIVGFPLKMLGIDPAIGYNLIIPTIFAMTALAAYAAASHLVASAQDPFGSRWPRVAGVAAAVSLVLLGNLGTFRMIFEALQRVGSAGAAGGNLLVDSWLAVKGFFRVLFGEGRLGIPLDAWYWEPSRAIPPGPGEPGPITEFPFFTFLYADLHAHMISLPFTVMSLVWGISTLRAAALKRYGGLLRAVVVLLAGALIVGTLRPTNTWDFPVYLILVALAAAVAGWLYHQDEPWQGLVRGLLSAGLLVLLSFLLFQPYARWYGQGYTEAIPWEGSKTPLLAYFTVYGLFLFVLVSWFLRETHLWMRTTPLAALSRVKGWFPYIGGLIVLLLIGVIVAAGMGYVTVLVVIPMLVWAGLLFLRAQPLAKRIILFLTGTALALTLVVEVVVLQGDIGRMNTVFKFYLQVWTLLSVAGGALVAILWREMPRWSFGWQALWRLGLTLLVLTAALYPLTATPAKIRDRMSAVAPASLDGSVFMQYAQRSELGERFELSEDYKAIHWLQQNVDGSPVIVEASIPEYHWGSRYTIYTGLPGVLGWNWHQRQQRVLSGAGEVADRAEAITRFYTTPSVEDARQFIDEYDVVYILVGQVEHIYFGRVEPCYPTGAQGQGVACDLDGYAAGMESPEVPAEACEPIEAGAEGPPLSCPTYGLEKFELMAQQGLLEVAYEVGDTRIYRVREGS